MAFKLLDGILFNEDVVHETHHDIESFVWVLCYSICRRLLTSQSFTQVKKKAITSFFHNAFGRVDLSAVRNSRGVRAPLEIPRRFSEFLSPPMILLLKNLDEHIQHQHLTKTPIFVTHEMILVELDNTISALRNV
jgi:hypothetical protein